MDTAELLERGDANLAAYLAHLARASGSGAVGGGPGLLLFAGAHNYPGAYTNGAIRTGTADDLPLVPAADVLRQAAEFFGDRRRGYALWVRAHCDADLDAAARAAGLWQRPPLEGNPGIAIERPVPKAAAPTGVALRQVVDVGGREDYLRVVAAAYGVGELPLATVEAILFSRESLLAPEVAAFVVYRRQEPVAGCMAYVAAGAAGLLWSATVPWARGAGLVHLAVRAACDAGFAMGARCATAQASVQGTPLWLRRGFRVVTHYRRYLARPTVAGADHEVSAERGLGEIP